MRSCTLLAAIKISSVNSRATLFAAAILFYPLYGTLLKFSNAFRRKRIVIEKAVVAYLSVSFEARNTSKRAVNDLCHGKSCS